MIKAVFFDLYHTLIRYEPPREESLAKALNEFGIKAEPETLRQPIIAADEFIYQEHARLPMSKRNDADRKALWARYQALMLREAGIEPTPELINGIIEKTQQVKFELILFDDVLPVLSQLKEKGLILGLISNVDRDMSPLFQKLGLKPLLDVVVTPQDSGYAKPQPEIFNEAARKAGIKTSEAMYVGDQYQIDAIGASRAGMKGILLDRGGFHKEVDRDMKIRDLYQLLEYLP